MRELKLDSRIKAQLMKVTQCELPRYDDATTEMIIPCTSNKEVQGVDFCCENKYRIELAGYLLIDNENFAFHSNWNQGRVPKDTVMDVEIIQLMGKMIKVKGYGIDIGADMPNGNIWEGWLPKKSVKIIAYY